MWPTREVAGAATRLGMEIGQRNEGAGLGDVQDVLRSCTRLVERKEKCNGGDVQKGGDVRVEKSGKGGNRR